MTTSAMQDVNSSNNSESEIGGKGRCFDALASQHDIDDSRIKKVLTAICNLGLEFSCSNSGYSLQVNPLPGWISLKFSNDSQVNIGWIFWITIQLRMLVKSTACLSEPH